MRLTKFIILNCILVSFPLQLKEKGRCMAQIALVYLQSLIFYSQNLSHSISTMQIYIDLLYQPMMISLVVINDNKYSISYTQFN